MRLSTERAQPARQVGGDEREQFEVWMRTLPDATGAIEAGLQEWDEVHQCYSNREGCSGAIQTAWVGWKARAALAPAAAEPEQGEWERCQQLADLPAVHEVLDGFQADPTGDNGVMVVREVLRALFDGAT